MKFEQGREFLKFDYPEDQLNLLESSDQSNGIAMPEREKPFKEEDLIFLPDPKESKLKKRDVFEVLDSRKSRRSLAAGEVEISELSFVLWAVQGLRTEDDNGQKRTAPSAGARNPFDTYFYAENVKNLKAGLYRYIWSRHAIVPVDMDQARSEKMEKQWGKAGFTIFWVAVPYRSEWRYIHYAHKFCAIDVGHIGQNGYLAAEALGIGCYAIGWYKQKEVDDLLGIDGIDEFVCYIEKFGKYES